MKEILQKAYTAHSLEKAEITALLKDNSINEELFKLADKVREEFVGPDVHFRGLIEFSNYCRKNCLYCGIRRENKKVKRFRLSEEKILSLAKKAKAKGLKTVVLQSGEDPFFTPSKLASIVEEIKKLNLAVTLSVGEMEPMGYKILKEAGADRFLLRIEASNPEIYKKFHPDSDYNNRFKCLQNLKALGFETGTGVIVGLDGQTDEDLAEDILFFKSLNADMVGLGPLIVSADTPLKGSENGDFTKTLKVMAITRLLLPDINIPATTAMETIQPNGRKLALQSGANVVMPNLGEEEKAFYTIYPDKAESKETYDTVEKAVERVESLGRKVSSGFGFRGGKNSP